MENSKIEWTHHTFNPWWGCAKVSAGCANCYAEKLDSRYNAQNSHWGPKADRKGMSDSYWKQPLKWNKDAEKLGIRHRVFCASMADVFEDRDDLLPHRDRLFELIFNTPNLDWLLLTKRPENILKLIRASASAISLEHENGDAPFQKWLREWERGKAPNNVWIGTSVENQEAAEKRVPKLLNVPAKVRFLSCEPLLGVVDLTNINIDGDSLDCLLGETCAKESGCLVEDDGPYIDWVIIGGESGPSSRPMHPEWARSLRDQCEEAGVAFLFKQWGEWSHPHLMSSMEKERGEAMFKSNSFIRLDENYAQLKIGKKAAGRELDGRTWDEVPMPEPTP